MKYPSHPDTLADRDSFRAARRDGIYATDSPAILGLSKWASPLSVYLSKVEDPAPEGPMSLQAFLGHQLEETLGQLWQERNPRTELIHVPDSKEYTHPQHRWLKAHLDFMAGSGIVECKTRMRQTPEWGEDGSSKVPVDIWVQVQHELLATGAQWANVAVLFGLHTFHVYVVLPDPGFVSALIPRLERFWTENVGKRIPPELTAHPADTAWSKRLPQTDDQLRQATPDQEELFRRYALAKANAKATEAAKDELENRIRDLIGEGAGITGAFGTATYKASKPSTSTGWELVAGSYRQRLKDAGVPESDLDTIQSIYTTTKPGSRRLLVKLEESDDE